MREPVAVYATTSSGGAFNVRVAIRQRVPGEARNAIGACMGALANCKNVFVVDPDIDIFSDEQMDWAMATRFQPDRDLIVMSGMRTLPLDPSLPPGSRIGAKAGYDLTWPFGQGDRLESRVPAPPTFAGKRFASVEAALADGPKFFEELMSAVGSRDGREVVRTLGGLRDKLALDRDGEGRYFIKSGQSAEQQIERGQGGMTMRVLSWVVLAALGAAGCAVAGAQEQTVKVGIARSTSNAAELMALKHGYFKEAGIKLEWDDIDTTANVIALLAQNQYQIVAGGISAGIFNALEKNLPITILSDRVSTPIGHNLMLRPDLKDTVKSLKDLKGRSVASNGQGSVSTYEIGKMLEREGLTLTDVDLKIFPFTQMGIAFKNKAIDAALADPAVRLAARGAGASRSRSPTSTSWCSRSR